MAISWKGRGMVSTRKNYSLKAIMITMARFTGHADLENYHDHFEKKGIYRAPAHLDVCYIRSTHLKSKEKNSSGITRTGD